MAKTGLGKGITGTQTPQITQIHNLIQTPGVLRFKNGHKIRNININIALKSSITRWRGLIESSCRQIFAKLNLNVIIARR